MTTAANRETVEAAIVVAITQAVRITAPRYSTREIVELLRTVADKVEARQQAAVLMFPAKESTPNG